MLCSQSWNVPCCSHPKAQKHGKTSKGSQRYRCPNCRQTFTETCDTLCYRRKVREETVRIVLQSHAEGSSLWGVSRISGLAYNTGVSIGPELLQLDLAALKFQNDGSTTSRIKGVVICHHQLQGGEEGPNKVFCLVVEVLANAFGDIDAALFEF